MIPLFYLILYNKGNKVWRGFIMSRRTISCLFSAAFLASVVVWAAPWLALHARHVLKRTAVVLVAAQKAALKGGKYFGTVQDQNQSAPSRFLLHRRMEP